MVENYEAARSIGPLPYLLMKTWCSAIAAKQCSNEAAAPAGASAPVPASAPANRSRKEHAGAEASVYTEAPVLVEAPVCAGAAVQP